MDMEKMSLEELNAEIKKLQQMVAIKKKKKIYYNSAECGVTHYSGSRPDEFYISVAKQPCEFDAKINSSCYKNVKVVTVSDKDQIIPRLNNIIDSLIGLRDLLENEEE